MIRINKELAFDLPEGCNLTDMVPRTNIVCAIVSLIAILILAIILIFWIRRHLKGRFYGMLLGFFVYLTFFYFFAGMTTDILFGTVFKGHVDDTAYRIWIPAIMCTIFAVGSRFLLMFIFSKFGNRIQDNVAFGEGIMVIEAFIAVANLYMVIVSCFTINGTGIEHILDGVTDKEVFDAQLKSIYEIINYKASTFLTIGITTMMYMIYHVAVTFMYFAPFKRRVSKLWYFYPFGSFLALKVVEQAANAQAVNFSVATLIFMIIAAITVVLALRFYNMYFKDEVETEKKKNEPPKKKMPRFDNNLSKL